MNAPLSLPIPNLNGALTWASADGSTLFMRLPPELQRPIDDAGCCCPYCVAHPEEPPMWDTLALTVSPKPGTRTNHAWTVHHPGPAAIGGRK